MLKNAIENLLEGKHLSEKNDGCYGIYHGWRSFPSFNR